MLTHTDSVYVGVRGQARSSTIGEPLDKVDGDDVGGCLAHTSHIPEDVRCVSEIVRAHLVSRVAVAIGRVTIDAEGARDHSLVLVLPGVEGGTIHQLLLVAVHVVHCDLRAAGCVGALKLENEIFAEVCGCGR